MDLIDRLREIAKRASSQLELLKTEEACKNALVMPFLSALGYDVFNPTEVIPEYIADVGIKKGEKVDYAILRDGDPIMLFECKAATCDLNKAQFDQLYRYFSVTSARFGVLTNGVVYRFFTDLDETNRMDRRPFIEIDIRVIDERQAAELKKFSKQHFDVEAILSNATVLKYRKAIKQLFAQEFANPSEELVRHFTSKVYEGRFTQSVREEFTDLVKRAFHEFVNDRIADRFQSAMQSDVYPSDGESDEEDAEQEITTTAEELEGYHIVRAIAAQITDPRRVHIRDTRSYCGVLLDDNNRKPLCRLLFDGGTKNVVFFDETKTQFKQKINSPEDIYQSADLIHHVIRAYDGLLVDDDAAASTPQPPMDTTGAMESTG